MSAVAAIASSEIALMVLTAAVLATLFRKTNQPTIIAYIVTGLVLGSVLLGLVEESEFTRLMSELGLSFLLFFIGLEIDFKEIQEIVKPTVLIAVSHMIVIGAIGYSLGFLLGFTMIEALFISVAVTFSSTAVVVKLLADKDLISTLPGKLDIGILLIQDLAVILVLTLLEMEQNSITNFAIRMGEVLFIVGGIGALSLYASRTFLSDWFKKIANNRHAFFIHSLTWLFIFLNLAETLNITMEIGAFVAGLSIAQIPYSKEIQERVRPLTDFFMALFFINIGLKLTPGNLAAYLDEAILASLVLIPAKFFAMFILADRSKFSAETSFKSSLNMVQVSEFALVLGAAGVASGVIDQDVLGFLSMVVLITMATSSYLIIHSQGIYRKVKFLAQRLGTEGEIEYEKHEMEKHAVIIGFDRMAQQAAKVLNQHYSEVIVIDKDPKNVEKLSRSPYKYVYGDFKHAEIRNAANIKKSDFIISFSPEEVVNKKVLEDADQNTTVFVKASNREDAAELYDLGAHYVIMKSVLTANKVCGYIESYLNDPGQYSEEIENYMHQLHWSDRDG